MRLATIGNTLANPDRTHGHLRPVCRTLSQTLAHVQHPRPTFAQQQEARATLFDSACTLGLEASAFWSSRFAFCLCLPGAARLCRVQRLLFPVPSTFWGYERKSRYLSGNSRNLMAEFRKRCINSEETGNIVDKKHAPDPPGYDLVAARESVSFLCPERHLI